MPLICAYATIQDNVKLDRPTYQRQFATFHASDANVANLSQCLKPFTNKQINNCINLRLNQPSTGSGTITFNSSYDFAGGTPFTASLTASNVDILTFISFDNTTLFGTGLKKFS